MSPHFTMLHAVREQAGEFDMIHFHIEPLQYGLFEPRDAPGRDGDTQGSAVRALTRRRRIAEPRFWMSDRNFYGIALDGAGHLCCVCEITIERPELPIGVEQLSVTNLVIGEDRLDLEFRRRAGKVVVRTAHARSASV